MKKILTILIILCVATASFAANITWKTSVASGDWDVASNWTGGVVPGTTDIAVFKNVVTVTGTQTNTVIQVRLNTGADVILDLDVTVTGADHGFLLNQDGVTLTLGTIAGAARTFTASSGTDDCVRLKGDNTSLNILASATLNLTAGNNGIHLFESGTALTQTVMNAGKINITTSGMASSSITSDALITGTITNAICGSINLGGLAGESGNPNRVKLNGTTSFTNNGLVTYSGTGVGVFTSAAIVTATNNAFFNYDNSGSFAGGTGTINDNGQDVSSGTFTVDAASSCTVADIGIDAVYTFYKEVGLTTDVGTNDGSGSITFNSDVWNDGAGTKVVYTCFGSAFTMTVNNVDGDCSDAVLPVELLFFNGKLEGNATVLNWSTASELNNEGFEIQKSANGTNWETLDFVAGNGTTLETQNYDFTDNKVANGRTYYRLKQVDFDGKFEFSNVVVIINNDNNATNTKVFPNPTRGIFNVNFDNSISGQAVIYNVFGQAVKTVQLNNQTNEISLENLANGTYYLQIVNGQTVENHTIVKQ